jgi:hypothetical protein
MKALAFLATLTLCSLAQADCQGDFFALQNRSIFKLVKERTIRLLNKRQLKFLIAIENHVVSDYMRLINFSFDGDNGLDVTNDAKL